jgi:Virulence-associated protein E
VAEGAVSDDAQDSVGSPDVTTEQARALAALHADAEHKKKAKFEAEAAPAVNPGTSLQERAAAAVAAQQQRAATNLRATARKAARGLADQLGLTRGPKVPYCDNSEENARKLVNHFMTGRLWFDDFTQRVLTDIDWNDPRTPCSPRAWEDTDDINATVFLQLQAGPKIRKSAVQDAVVAVAHANRRNCVVDWLKSLQWDGVPRIASVFPRLFGTPSTPYHLAAGQNLFISMVARAMDPGCKVDEMIVLEGPQHVGKSTAWKVIGGKLHAELHANPNHKDFQQQFRGVWLGELPEMSALRRTTVEQIKGMLTCRVDRYRPSYGRYEREYPRQTVCGGTTNQDKYLQDDTGNRRFIPIRVRGSIDIAQLQQERDQLFAEAVALYKKRQSWWQYPVLETRIAQEARYVGDPWIEQVKDTLVRLSQGQPPQPITAASVMNGMGVPVAQQNRSMSTRVGVALRKLGGVSKTRWVGGMSGTPITEWTFPGGLPK